MPQFNLGDYGILGGVLLLFMIILYKGPDIIKAFKGASVVPVSSANSEDNREVLQGLTVAITKLTTFLETDTAVNTEKDKALQGNIKEILEEIRKLQESTNKLITIMSEHTLKCEMTCQSKR